MFPLIFLFRLNYPDCFHNQNGLWTGREGGPVGFGTTYIAWPPAAKWPGDLQWEEQLPGVVRNRGTGQETRWSCKVIIWFEELILFGIVLLSLYFHHSFFFLGFGIGSFRNVMDASDRCCCFQKFIPRTVFWKRKSFAEWKYKKKTKPN